MRIASLIVTVVLALSFGPTAWASPNDPSAAAKKPAQAKSSSPSKPGKVDEVNLGSALRRELLKNRLQGTKAAAGKPAASKQKSKAKS